MNANRIKMTMCTITPLVILMFLIICLLDSSLLQTIIKPSIFSLTDIVGLLIIHSGGAFGYWFVGALKCSTKFWRICKPTTKFDVKFFLLWGFLSGP